jgi:hypothetical protein
MKSYLYKRTLLCLFIAGCAVANENPVTLTIAVDTTPSATMTETLQPVYLVH